MGLGGHPALGRPLFLKALPLPWPGAKLGKRREAPPPTRAQDAETCVSLETGKETQVAVAS